MNYKDLVFIIGCLIGICCSCGYIYYKINEHRTNANLDRIELKRFLCNSLINSDQNCKNC